MAFSPLLSICKKENGTVLSVTDITGVYHVTTNPTGWNNPNPDANNILNITLDITYPSEEVQTVALETVPLTEVPDPIIGSFTYSDITLDYNVDGVHQFDYTVETEEGTFYYRQYKLFLTNVKCCIDKLWAQVPSKMCTECETEEFINRVLFAQGLYNTLIRMGGCGYTPLINKLLTQIQKLCSFEDCNC